MNHCKDCKHYRPYDRTYGVGPYVFGCCDMATTEGEDEKIRDGTLAWASGTYGGWLRTSPEFGCVQWSPTEPLLPLKP